MWITKLLLVPSGIAAQKTEWPSQTCKKNENEVDQPVSDGLDHLHADIRRSVADFPATVRCAILSSLLVGPAPRATKAEAEKRHEKRNTEQHLNGSMIAKTCCCF